MILKIIKTKFFKQIYIISIIYFCNFAETSLAQTDKKKVIKMLEGRHWILNKNKFNSLGKGTDNILIDIAGDNKIIKDFYVELLYQVMELGLAQDLG